jgi:hypothetical protein
MAAVTVGNASLHSDSQNATVDSETRISHTNESITNEKEKYTVAEVGVTEVDKAAGDDDFPDGGLRAWLIVVGVSDRASIL